METRELPRLAILARALWLDAREAGPALAETVATISLQELSAERALERTARGLLDHAARRPSPVAPESAFFRLAPEERFTLAALHHARWSYARLGRILGLEPERVAELAWGARLQLATAPGVGSAIRAPFPSASGAGHGCPDYHPGRPWTQRFLDEELSPRERAFLRSHAEGCTGCRQALTRARAFYYAVGSLVPRLTEAEESHWGLELSRVRDRSHRMRGHEVTFAGSLVPLLRRWDMRVACALAAAFAIWALVT